MSLIPSLAGSSAGRAGLARRSDPAGHGNEKLGWGVKALILAGGPAVGMAISGISAALPRIEADLAATAADKYLIKMMVGAVGAAMICGAPLTGFLADRFRLRQVVFINYLMIACAGSAGLYVDNLQLLVASRFVLGVATGGAVTASIIMINRMMPPERRAHWLGGYIAASFVGSIVLQPVAGVLAEADWHHTFAIYLIAAPFAALALMSLPGDALPAYVAEATDEYAAASRERLGSWFPFGLASFGLAMGCITYLPVIYTPFLLRDLGIGPKLISFALLGDALTGVLAALVFGASRRFVSPSGAFVLALLATAIGGAVTAFAGSYLGVVIGLAIIGLGTGWFMPNLMDVLGARVKVHQQGRAAGLVKGINYASTPLCIVAIEGIAQAHGPRLPILISAVLSLALLLVVAVQMRTSRQLRLPV